jgi:small-conductance mechanosensitive channel
MEKLHTFLEFQIFKFKDHSLMVFEVLSVILIFIVTKVILWLVKKAIDRKYKKNEIDKGSYFAVYQLVKYFLWIISAGFMLEAVGIQYTIFLTSSAALLVGIGLGLQQTFNDIISGVILLFEQSVKVEDILDIDGDIVTIKEIGLRTSKGMNRNEIIITIPNSLITTNKVINWSNQSKKTLFRINVGVAYGSDVNLVIKLLIESANEHSLVIDKKNIDARFSDFGNSSLDFTLLFFSEELFAIEKVKSDIRKSIYQKFSDNNIAIPFPQMDLHIKNQQ